MKIFPTLEKEFRVNGKQAEMLDRLIRRTDKSENLTSQFTDKSFRGMVNGNQFKLISSLIGFGAFCVLTGTIDADKGHVKVEIHKVFRGFLIVFLLFPVLGFVAMALSDPEEFSPFLIFIVFLQILFIRFVFIGLAFRFLSKESLNRLRDVLDVEWIN